MSAIPPISKDVLLTHLDYTAWATGLLLDAASAIPAEDLTRDVGVANKSMLGTLQHIYYADRVWLGRLRQTAPEAFMDPDPGPSLAVLKTAWPDVLTRLRALVAELIDEEIASELHFRMLSGAEVRRERWKVILHVVNHATLHRGQVMAMIRQLGIKPPSTDLMGFYAKQA